MVDTETTLDITPTWSGILPMLIMFLKSKKTRDTGEAELARMAQAADRFNELLTAKDGDSDICDRLGANVFGRLDHVAHLIRKGRTGAARRELQDITKFLK